MALNKHEIMLRMSKEGHSFPHWDTCKTCEEDFDEVCEWERIRILKLIDDEEEIVKQVCLGLTHPPQENQPDFTKWLQDTVNFHLNQLKQKLTALTGVRK